MTNLILQCCKEQSNEPIGRYRTSYSHAHRHNANRRNDHYAQQVSHNRHHIEHQQFNEQREHDHNVGRSLSILTNPAQQSRPPSPNCHCSCHENYSREYKHHSTAPKSVSWSVSPSPHPQPEHSRFPPRNVTTKVCYSSLFFLST